MKKAAKGLSLMLVVKLLSKFLQLFLNFEVIKKVEPTVFGLSTYFVTLTIFQTTLNKVLLPQVYQKRSGNLDDKKTKISAKNLVRQRLANMLRWSSAFTSQLRYPSASWLSSTIFTLTSTRT